MLRDIQDQNDKIIKDHLKTIKELSFKNAGLNRDIREMKDTQDRSTNKIILLEGELNQLGAKYKQLESKHYQHTDTIKDLEKFMD